MYPLMANALVDEISSMDVYQREFLGSLPPQMELEFEGVKVLLVHGSPRVNNEEIRPGMPMDEINEMLADTDADVIFCGHTHIPCGYQTNTKQTIVNVGSVGRPMTPEPFACYVIADFNNGGVSFEHRFVDYDRDIAAYLLGQRDFEGAAEIAQILLNPTGKQYK
jgi:predicted phosphodiesterase